MMWQQWTIIALYALSAANTIAMIGKPREPITPNNALFWLVIVGFMVWLVVSL